MFAHKQRSAQESLDLRDLSAACALREMQFRRVAQQEGNHRSGNSDERRLAFFKAVWDMQHISQPVAILLPEAASRASMLAKETCGMASLDDGRSLSGCMFIHINVH